MQLTTSVQIRLENTKLHAADSAEVYASISYATGAQYLGLQHSPVLLIWGSTSDWTSYVDQNSDLRVLSQTEISSAITNFIRLQTSDVESLLRVIRYRG